MSTPSSLPPSMISEHLKIYSVWFIGTFIYIAIWWGWTWPAHMYWDTVGYLDLGLKGEIDSLHSHLYSFIINTVVIPSMRVAPLAALQLLLATLVLTRLYVELWAMRPPFWAKAWGLIVLLSPLTPLMAVYIIGDSVFAFAMLGLLFEVWLIAYRGKSTWVGWILIACYTPLALFTRENGKILALLLPLLTWSIYQRHTWIKLSAYLVACLILGNVLSALFVPGEKHPVFLPVAVQEMAGFALPRPNQETGKNLSSETKEFLASMGVTPEQLAANYHPYYWDYVGFIEKGPTLNHKTPEQKNELVKLFFTRELWKNLPAFFGHRTEVFLAMCFARSTHIDPAHRFGPLHAKGISLQDTQASRLPASLNAYVDKIYKTSYRLRWLLWNALPSVVLMLALLLKGGWRNPRMRIVLVPLAIQTIGIYALAPAAEYRYVFPLFLCTPLMLLVWQAEKVKRPE